MNSFTAEQRRDVPVLDRFKCSVCQKWKQQAYFSKKELGKYTYKKASGQSVDGVSAHLRCSICTGAGVAELKCQGPCGLVLALDSFSKQARCNGGSNWCLACTGWKEAAEPGVTTAPAVSTDIAPDEQDAYATTTATDDDNGALSDPEAGAYSDDDYDGYSYGYSTAASEADAASSTGARTNFVAVPYHALGALSLQSGASDAKTEKTSKGLTPEASTRAGGVSGNGPTYTAYDAQGNGHQKQLVPSDTASDATEVPSRNNSNWAKPTGRRVDPKPSTPVVLPPRRAYDSESEDEM